jgi:hypothetical protein
VAQVIALINLLARFSSSIETYHKLSAQLREQHPEVMPAVRSRAAVS